MHRGVNDCLQVMRQAAWVQAQLSGPRAHSSVHCSLVETASEVLEREAEGFPRKEEKRSKGAKKRLLTTRGGSCGATRDMIYESIERSGLEVQVGEDRTLPVGDGELVKLHQGAILGMVSKASYPSFSADGRNGRRHGQCKIHKTAQEGLRAWLGPVRTQLKAEFPRAGGQATGAVQMHLQGG